MRIYRFEIYGEIVVNDDSVSPEEIREDIETCVGLPDCACQIDIDEVNVEE